MTDTAAALSCPLAPTFGRWHHEPLPAEIGSGLQACCQLDDGLTVIYTRYRLQQDLLLQGHVDHGAPALTITIALEGESSTLATGGQRYDFLAGQSRVMLFQRAQGLRRFPARRPLQQLRLIASAAWLRRYGLAHMLDDGHTDDGAPLYVGPSSIAATQLAQRLVQLYTRQASLLELHLVALSLIAEHTRPALARAAHATPPHPHDARIRRARDLVLQQYRSPPSVAALSAAVGLSPSTLKQGFRRLLDSSPQQWLTTVRMQHAWTLLESGHAVSTVADRVGYQHVSSFSAAFSRHYGRSPKSVAGLASAPRRTHT